MKYPFYRLLTLACILPAIVFQGSYPIIPTAWYEDAIEQIYSLTLSYRHEKLRPSPVVIVEINEQTEQEFGWPLPRRVLAQALSRLALNGRPWILSLLQLQDTSDPHDEILEQMIRNYDRYIGSGLDIGSDGDIPESLYPLLRQSLVLSNNDAPIEALPLKFTESPQYVKAQKAFGLPPRYGTESSIYCAPFYTHTVGLEGGIVLPGSILWLLSHLSQSDFKTSFGLSSKRWQSENAFHVARKNCLSEPAVTTKEYFAKAQIPIVGLNSVLQGQISSLEGKVVLLASHKMRRFQGPGSWSAATEDRIIPEHHLTARFLDNFLSGRILFREPIELQSRTGILPLGLSLLLFITALLGNLPIALFTSLCGLGGLLAWSALQMIYNQTVIVPIHSIFYLLVSAAFLASLVLYLRFVRFKLINQSRHKLHETWNDVRSWQDLRGSWLAYLNNLGQVDGFEIQSKNKDLHEALASEKITKLAPMTSKELLPNRDFVELHRQRFSFILTIRIDRSFPELGEIRFQLQIPAWQQYAATELITSSLQELEKQWRRVEIEAQKQAHQMSLVFHSLKEDILSKFLTQSITSRFKEGADLDSKLQDLLTPHPIQASILQADIRGYSGLFQKMDSLEIAKLVKGYYETTVNEAQKVGQVKVIGDCLFIFIEDQEQNSVAQMVELASILVRETSRRNADRNGQPLNFGIAIHYGQAIVGNLSSDNCIDYTVVGPNVNQTARMEELTKDPQVRQLIGANGVLISVEAQEQLQDPRARQIDLHELGLQVRSFPDVQAVYYITAPTLINSNLDEAI
ncbi:adenylate/guanylate cyclase domain-containing protein [Pseudobacteriovorax antillogorgiicola]|uniref:Adenylate cyclase, class 3 n=1 Tax=Pseudobacteriovorax antillogorgiicola TaxID=1513793 RepID=A0A1Y6BFA7_9BACT|nr:adenylate/guanylate cyclase domain-containing protein [Pseudobacteriovorax antillogorgiicola]TCS56234.1 class 3 adenylate cyclase [Pseudobacteriovorax antillogorgiicola]SMF08220.1 Adenylate cyclase, class 3 [Pseudobacteriovorax antillogorgiicola]